MCINSNHKSKTQRGEIGCKFQSNVAKALLGAYFTRMDYIKSLLVLMYNPPTLSIRRIRSKVSQALELKLAKGTEQGLSMNRALEQL